MELFNTVFNSLFHFCLLHNLSFAAWKLPGKSFPELIAGPLVTLNNNLQDNSFVIAPFYPHEPYAIDPSIRYSNGKLDSELPAFDLEKALQPLALNPVEMLGHHDRRIGGTDPEIEFISLVKNILTEINDNKVEKVVASTRVCKSMAEEFKAVDFIKQLWLHYPLGFVSFVWTPQHGCWIGASPEVLLRWENNQGNIFAMAGTRSIEECQDGFNFTWKENNEQKIVSTFISELLKEQKISYNESTADLYRSGNLIHIRTLFTLDSQPTDLLDFINKLHPTPAVAGFPQKYASDFILKNENHKRDLYAGYLGPYYNDSSFHFYVNLRCMELFNNAAYFYAGAGVVKGSDPELEWNEINNKLETLLGLIPGIREN